jgi:hypothetical protein
MRIVEFEDRAVRRQRKTAEGKIKVTFYDAALPPRYVTEAEWAHGARNKYYAGDVRRREVVR